MITAKAGAGPASGTDWWVQAVTTLIVVPQRLTIRFTALGTGARLCTGGILPIMNRVRYQKCADENIFL